MNILRKTVFFAGVILFVLWFWPNTYMLTGDHDGLIRLMLGSLFALVIMLRLKPLHCGQLGGTAGIIGAGITGLVFAVTGMVFTVHQLEWLGIILVLYACMRWSLPDRWASDIVRALFLVYWIHPLPGRLFGWFEMLMQKASVAGSEWVLHMINVRVWADGIFLRTGNHVFGVPEACSGMRTAVTMLICVLGVSILLRQKWWETIIFMLLGGLQVLLLNIARISFMVIWSQRMPPAWSSSFLHDSLGGFLLLAIFLVQVEMSWWKLHRVRKIRLAEMMKRDEVEEPETANILPRIWYLILKASKWVFLVLLVVLCCVYAGYKRRPEHRAAMLADVVEGLMKNDIQAAEPAVNQALAFQPGSRSLLDKRAHVLILKRKYQEVLDTLAQVAGPLDTFETVMKSWALMSLGRHEDAMSVISALPEDQMQIPGVAIVKAEYAALLDNTAEVSSNVIIASGTSFTVERVRELYPYLAVHEQWNVIARIHNFDVPFERVQSALITIQAFIKQQDLASASRALEKAMEKWPDDIRLLNALYYMAVRRPGEKWEEYFADSLRANIHLLDADDAARQMEMSFKLSRPDLGWLAYNRLKSIDPEDPSLDFAPARFGGVWFTFRRHQLGVNMETGRDTISLEPVISLTRSSSFLDNYWKAVPLINELSGEQVSVFRARSLEKAIHGFEKRIAAGNAGERIETSYPMALGLAGRFAEAHAFLDKLEALYPDRRPEIYFQHADFYHGERKWQEAYESMRKHVALKDTPSLTADLIFIDILMNMNMGIYALEVLRQGRLRYPGAKELVTAEASLWAMFGFSDTGLFLIGDALDGNTLAMRIKLLFDTGRYREAERLIGAVGWVKPDMSKVTQKIALPPAELSVQNRWPPPHTPEQMASEARAMEGQKHLAVSPFIRKLLEAEVNYLKSGGRTSIKEWANAGRDSMEKAAALHRLSVLAGRQGQKELSRDALAAAVEHMPESAILWRILAAVTEGDRQVVSRAVAQCPGDPEIWLAHLVNSVRDKVSGDAVLEEVRQVAGAGSFSMETLIRAGDFLLRSGYNESAYLLAETAGTGARGLLAADMLELRCALVRKDARWATSAALKGVQHSLDPVPFYEMIVGLKSAGRMADAELVEALEHLKEAFPGETKWTDDLGMVYFEKGDTVRAFSVLDSLIKEDMKNVTVRSFLLAAESARLEGQIDKSIDILKAAYELYPDRSMVLNNLVYSLAMDPKTLNEAERFLDALERVEDKTFHVYDTIAMVHLRKGRLSEATKYMKKALEVLENDGYSASEVRLNAAEMLLKTGDIEAARKQVDSVQNDPDRTDMIDRKARELLDKIRQETGTRL